MKNIGTLYRFELRKILSRKLTWVMLLIILSLCISMIVSVSNNIAITVEHTNESGALTSTSFTHKEYFFQSREASRKLATVVLKYQFQAAVFLLKNWTYGGCIKVAHF